MPLRFWFTSSPPCPDSLHWGLPGLWWELLRAESQADILALGVTSSPQISHTFDTPLKTAPLSNPAPPLSISPPRPRSSPQPASVLWIFQEGVRDQPARAPSSGVTFEALQQSHGGLSVIRCEVKEEVCSSLWGQDSKHPSSRCRRNQSQIPLSLPSLCVYILRVDKNRGTRSPTAASKTPSR